MVVVICLEMAAISLFKARSLFSLNTLCGWIIITSNVYIFLKKKAAKKSTNKKRKKKTTIFKLKLIVLSTN